jgi:hypothetical protein
VRRTQLYLDESLWTALHVRAQNSGTTISQLVRDAVREQYLGRHEEQRKAMLKFIGSRKEKPGDPDATTYIRGLRRGDRLERS